MSSILSQVRDVVAPGVFQDGEPIGSAVQLQIGAVSYSGWQGLTVTKSLSQLSHAFAFEMKDIWTQNGVQWPFKPGSECLVRLRGQTLIHGYINSLDATLSPTEKTVSVQGRDLTQDAVDCSAPVGTFKNSPLLQLSAALLSEIGPTVSIDPASDTSNALKPFNQFVVDIGDTVFNCLDRAAKLRGFFLRSDGRGEIVFWNRGSLEEIIGTLREGENILSASARYSDEGRFSTVKVYAQSPFVTTTSPQVEQSSQATAQDSNVARPRPLQLIADGPGTNDDCEQRAKWEIANRAANGFDAQIKVQGWETPGGEFWELGKLVDVDCPSLGMSGYYFIVSATFQVSDQGTTTSLNLSRADAFEAKLVYDDSNEPSADIGANQDKNYELLLRP